MSSRKPILEPLNYLMTMAKCDNKGGWLGYAGVAQFET